MKKIASMQVHVEGVAIELTPDQIALVQERIKYLRQSKLSFLQVLRKYGFRKLDPEEGAGYVNEKMDWWADINNHDRWHTCYIAGPGIPRGMFPEPKCVDEPADLATLLNKALEDPATWEITYKHSSQP